MYFHSTNRKKSPHTERHTDKRRKRTMYKENPTAYKERFCVFNVEFVTKGLFGVDAEHVCHILCSIVNSGHLSVKFAVLFIQTFIHFWIVLHLSINIIVHMRTPSEEKPNFLYKVYDGDGACFSPPHTYIHIDWLYLLFSLLFLCSFSRKRKFSHPSTPAHTSIIHAPPNGHQSRCP